MVSVIWVLFTKFAYLASQARFTLYLHVGVPPPSHQEESTWGVIKAYRWHIGG